LEEEALQSVWGETRAREKAGRPVPPCNGQRRLQQTLRHSP
jgi:hypothetical protein